MGMTCCSSDGSVKPTTAGNVYPTMGQKPRPQLRKRDNKHFYDITFTSRPLHITLTSSNTNVDGYITAFNEHCPVKDEIILNSKVIYVNGNLVEGLEVTEIAKYLSGGELPLRLTLARPEGLVAGEVPDMEPQ